MSSKTRAARQKRPNRALVLTQRTNVFTRRIILRLANGVRFALLGAGRAARGSAALVTRPFRRRVVEPSDGEYVVRFDGHQRIQHVLMFTTFLVLAVTGLPQKFHTWDTSQWLIAALGGLEMVQRIHRVAAFTMLFDCAYHGIYIAYTMLVRKQRGPLQMIPTPKDVLDAFQMFKYFLGLSEDKPRFGRFSYLEKFDYWAVFWGIAVIGGSGLVLIFPVEVSRFLPGGIVPVTLAAHSDEAVLAVGWIFVVHFFYVHLAPAVFPFNPSIFTGRVPKHQYAEEHPLDYARMIAVPPPGQAEVVPVRAGEDLVASGIGPLNDSAATDHSS